RARAEPDRRRHRHPVHGRAHRPRDRRAAGGEVRLPTARAGGARRHVVPGHARRARPDAERAVSDEYRPYTLVAELTYRCPLRCVYCSNPVDYGRHTDGLDTADWRRVFREAEELGVVQLHLTGGEPLLRDDLETLIEGARAGPPGAGQYAVCGVGTREPARLAADRRPAGRGATGERRSACAVTRQNGSSLRHARLLLRVPEGVYGRLGPALSRRQPRRPGPALPRGSHAARARVRECQGPPARGDLARLAGLQRLPR